MFTDINLRKIFPQTSTKILNSYIDPLNLTIEKYEIKNIFRESAFIAQIGHESGGLIHTKEKLNYSSSGLLKTFSKYFSQETASDYARQPEKIANKVYANRMGNGNEESGDGWKFRGRGFIQLTGRENYTKFAENLNVSLEDIIKYLETPEGIVISAGWFWNKKDLNKFADKEDIITITKKINGGLNGIEDRKQIYQRAKIFL